MTYDAGLWTLATTGMTLLAALVVAITPVLMAALITLITDVHRATTRRSPTLPGDTVAPSLEIGPSLDTNAPSTSESVAPRPAA